MNLCHTRFAPILRAAKACVGLLLCSVGMSAEISPIAAAKQLANERKYEEARAAFEAIAAADPTNARVAFYLGKVALVQRDHASALNWLGKAAELDPAQAEYCRMLGITHMRLTFDKNAGVTAKLKGVKAAMTRFDQAIELDPNDTQSRLLRATLNVAVPWPVGSKRKALDDLLEVQKSESKKAAEPLMDLYVATKEYDNAFIVCEQMIQAHPAEMKWRYSFGKLASITALNLDRGEALLREYLLDESLPKHASAHSDLAAILKENGNLAEARAEYQAALVHDPKNSRALKGLKTLD